MTRWMVAVTVLVVILCGALIAAPYVFAQAPGGAFERLSPGNQKAARALFEAQKPDAPRGVRPMSLDEISSRKENGEGWTRVFESMKARGLVDARTLGEVVLSYDNRHQISAAGADRAEAGRVR